MVCKPHRILFASAILGGFAALGCYWGEGPLQSSPPVVNVTTIAGKPAVPVPMPHLAQSLQPLFEVEPWHFQFPSADPLAPTETWASRQVEATSSLLPEALPVLANVREGQHLRLPLHGGSVLAQVTLVERDDDGWTRAAGTLEGGARGSFFLSQKGPAFFGRITQPGLGRAYRIATDPDGSVTMEQKPLGSVACAAIPRKPRPPGSAEQPSAPVRSIAAAEPVPSLDSNPAATSVIYLDFDGETVTDPDWNGGHPIVAAAPTLKGVRISAAQITDVWQRVAEDYRPFKVSVTTNLSRYTAAGARHRMRCIVTPTDTAEPGAGGVAWTDSFREAGVDFSSTVPCWAFAEDYYSTADISGIISHEVGHTMGLSHDGRVNPYEEYFYGQGSGSSSWAPIMGATYDHKITQWSKGEYYRANNHEDDVAIIGSAANAFGFATDEDTASTPVTLPNSGLISVSGIITSSTDTDQYMFATAGGTVSLAAAPAAIEPNLDIMLEIRDRTGATVLATGNLLNALNATLSTTLPLGTYRVVVRGTGEGSALGVGYSAYGSLGAYTLTGSYPSIPVMPPVITTQPVSAGRVAGSAVTFSVAATSAVPPSYQWQRNGVDIPGQTSSTLVFTSVQAVNQADYRCIVSNVAGSTPSNSATLSLFVKPTITKQPVATSVAMGSPTPLTLSVTATGTAAIRYQWQHGTTDIPGQTASTLSLPNPQWTDGGSYRCVVSNDYGSVISSAVVVTIIAPPSVITQPPAAKELPKGGTSSIALVSGGTPPLSYQWYKGNDKVVGAVSATLTFAKITDAAAGTYHCVVTNKIGTATSKDCAVTVGIVPAITLQPLAQTVHEGNSFQFSIAATGTPTLVYQWQRDGVNVGTGTTFSVASAAWSDRGVYRCIVSNGAGTTISKAVALTVQAGPIIVTPPTSAKIAIGGRATLKVVATGSPALKYQWRKSGVSVPGATAASLTITGTTNTSYDVVVSNPFNTAGVTTTPAAITALAAPKITQQPVAKTAALGSGTDFAVQATGDGVLNYQWKKNGIAMSGQTTASLHLGNMLATDAALYSVTVTNEVGTAASVAARLTLLAPPKIVVKPVATTAKASTSTTLTASASGAGTLKYHWQKDNADIIGAISPTFKIASTRTADAGMYRVVVSNAVDTAYSDAVPLTVVIPKPPVIAAFTPTQGMVGSFVRVMGTDLDNITKVTLLAAKGGSANAAFVIVSSQELLVTVPAGAATSVLTLSGIGGTTATASVFTVTTKQANDDFINAQIIPGTGGTVTGNNATMTAQAGEPSHAPDPSFPASDYQPSRSVWYSWTPSITGPYSVSTLGSAFDTRLAVYTGNAVNALTVVTANDEASDTLSTSYALFSATAGTTYFIAVDGFAIHYADTGDDYNEYGAYTLKVAKITAREPSLADDGASASGPAWLPLTLPAHPASITAALRFQYAAAPGAEQQGSWVVCNASRQPLFGLHLATATGELSVSSLSVQSFVTGQTLVPDEKYRLEFAIDTAHHTWGALLNGEWVVQDQRLPPGVAVAGVQVQWAGGADQNGAGVTVDHFEVTAE